MSGERPLAHLSDEVLCLEPDAPTHSVVDPRVGKDGDVEQQHGQEALLHPCEMPCETKVKRASIDYQNAAV